MLRTTFVTAGGEVDVTDALALEPSARGHDIGRRSPHTLLRRVEGRRGTVAMTTEVAPRMEYGLTSPHWSDGGDGLVARGGPVTLSLHSDVAFYPPRPHGQGHLHGDRRGDGGRLRRGMYGVAGERDLTEHTLSHLSGFADSRPVRIGNDAWDQSQLDVLALGGDVERAEAWFNRATSYANDLGLLAEEADPERRELLGNFPQAFSHVGLINAAWRLTEATRASPSTSDDDE